VSAPVPPSSATDPLLGAVLDGGYRVLEKLGRGGMGTVYRAEARHPDGTTHHVAVKVLLDELLADAAQRERFEREARALFGLEHPNILAVHDFGFLEGSPYLVMELLDGQSLGEYAEEHPPDPETALTIARQILAGLAYAHAQGALHRDLKTENVFVARMADGSLVAKLLDFGLVKFVDDDRWGSGRVLTTFGEVFGTPAYMSPEQCTGAPVDARADVYSMGVVLYELLTGRWPFMAESRGEMLRAHLMEPPPPLAEARHGLRARPELEGLVQTALAKDKGDRFADAGAMLAALDAVPRPAAFVTAETPSVAPPSMPAPPKKVPGAAVNALLVALGLLLLLALAGSAALAFYLSR